MVPSLAKSLVAATTLLSALAVDAVESKRVQQQRHNPFLAKRQLDNTTTEYDYVVVGSGPGGGPLAANLAEGGYKVLLIDAGGDSGDNLFETVPLMFPRATDEFPETQWNYFVTRSSDPAVQALDGVTSYELPDGTLYTGLDPPANATALGTLYPRAGTLGGCARHNAIVTIRAFDSDWDTIADLTGDTSFNGSTFQRLFEKIEHCNYLPNSVVGHGFRGWFWTELTSLVMAVQDLKLVSIIVSAASAMGESLLGIAVETAAGLAELLAKDINAPGTTISNGPYQIPLSMKNQTRHGVRERVLAVANAVDADGNRLYHLDIKLHTLVTKIQFSGSAANDTLRATGVEFCEGEALYRADTRSAHAVVEGEGSVAARKDVIIAAGAFNTPQLLKLSGIGPADELAAWEIESLVDLPVGSNLADHIEVPIINESPTNFTLTEGCTFMYGYPDVPDPCLDKYLAATGDDEVAAAAKGVYATSGAAIGVVMQSSAAAAAGRADPDVIVYGEPANFPGFQPGWAHLGLALEHRHWTWISLKATTRNNAGTVTLASTDPRDRPVVAFNTFEGSDAAAVAADLQASYEGVAFARRAMDALVPLDGDFVETQPGRASVASEAAIKEYVRTNSFGHHACCTAPIGEVLDSNFRVQGVQGLRVVDASAFPVIPGFFVQLPIYLLSEKASEAILSGA